MAGARIIEIFAEFFEKAFFKDTAKDAEKEAERYATDTEKKISQRIDELKTDGPGSHGPQRHLEVTDAQLQQRLGTPQFNPDGTPKLKPSGFVKSAGSIDPMTGTTTDAVTGGLHHSGNFATRFDSPAEYAYADNVLRARADATGNGAQSASIESLLGPDGYKGMTGYYIDPANPGNYAPVNFQGGSISARYKFNELGQPYLYTMYPEPAPGVHP
jgi:hypothetical protein